MEKWSLTVAYNQNSGTEIYRFIEQHSFCIKPPALISGPIMCPFMVRSSPTMLSEGNPCPSARNNLRKLQCFVSVGVAVVVGMQ